MGFWKYVFLFVVLSSKAFVYCEEEVEEINLSYFQELPKADLHLHLGGSYPLDFLQKLATSEQKEALLAHLEAIAKGISYQDAFGVFKIIGQIVNSDEKVEAGTYALCRSLESDNVLYAEIRTSLKDLGNGIEGYLQAVLRGIEKGCSESFEAALILSLQRASSLDNAKATVDLALRYKDRGIVGIDISDNATVGTIETIMPELLRAKKGGLALTVHMGESPGESDQQYILEMLEPDRIGHGVHLTAEATAWIKERNIPVEVCLTSSVQVQMIENYSEHPGFKYFKDGYPIVLCSDDSLIFRTTLSEEFFRTYNASGLSVEQLKSIASNSFKYAFR